MSAAKRHLRWTIPTAYVALFVLVTSVSHAMEGRASPQPVVSSPAPPAPASSSRAAVHQALPATSSPRRAAAPRYSGTLVDRHGVFLPDRSVTPGAVNRHVSQANLQSTICRSGYSQNVRPPSSYTTALKVKQLNAGYTDHGDETASDYEEDHLVSLELGGNPKSVKNLWPEPIGSPVGGADTKDTLENKLHELVCNGELNLRQAQHDEAVNWYAAYRKYILVPAQRARAAARRARIAAQRRAAAARRAQRQAQRRSRQTYAPPPPPTSCTTTSSGSCIQGGEFCPQADYGQTGTDANGTVYTCTGDSEHPHWE